MAFRHCRCVSADILVPKMNPPNLGVRMLLMEGIIEVAGEPGDHWLRLMSGGAKPPLPGRSERKVRTPS